MLENLIKDLKDGLYRIYPAKFEVHEILDMMAPSFVIGKEGKEYLFIFDPRSVTSTGSCENIESKKLEEYFSKLVEEPMRVAFTKEGNIVESLEDELNFYEEMDVSLLEDNVNKISHERFKKITERFKIFSMISEKTKDMRYSINANIISISPGVAGTSLIITLNTRFMIWLRNETTIEGAKFKYSLIRIFNVIVAKLSHYFKYERISIFPYESLILLPRNAKEVAKFLKAIDVINKKARSFFVENFPNLVRSIKEDMDYVLDDIIKSKEAFLENLASLSDKKAFEYFKERIINSMEEFCRQLDPISKVVGEWMDKLLEEVEK
ncbi:MAG: hypothetical protein J7L34_04000 [Thermotogaceae bacterium]|nr:hypothetical protein [Thermotogaceae bacterium]